jgi:hypothetical protein
MTGGVPMMETHFRSVDWDALAARAGLTPHRGGLVLNMNDHMHYERDVARPGKMIATGHTHTLNDIANKIEEWFE